MKCPKCQFENREGAKFCKKCGAKLEVVCPSCGYHYKQDSIFCDQCGQRLKEVVETEKTAPRAEGERKHVTVLFSDLSGYTTMSEKLDPEEVKEVTSRIFGDISKVIDKYAGFVEKFVGDAVMAIFGVPKAHEDDPIRAIKAAREIHKLVTAISPEIEKLIGQPISMHTGINTGIVVTGEVDMEKGTHGLAGDAINLAFRLSSIANSGEILVGPDTYRQAEGHFVFETLEPTTVKGKARPVQVYRILDTKERPVTIHRTTGLRADLVGRKVEMSQLGEALERLREGKGSVISICGDAGTGKSRLVEEFKATLDLAEIQWIEGCAYAYAQNIPYFQLIDLLNRVFEIKEGDPPEKVREKVESGIEDLVERREGIVPYVGSLYALTYPEAEDVSPEFWKSRLQDAIQTIFSALAQKSHTIFFLEDLHWADSAYLELLRHCLLEIRHPAIVLCVYRPTISLFTSQQLFAISKFYHEIRLHDLSPSEAHDMVESLLKTDTIPYELQQFVQKKVEGNPFYLEEVINSFIESKALVCDNNTWKLTRQISELEISSTIHGVISARLDRLEKETKRILQEASVIGRAFLFEILKRVTELEQDIDRCLRSLEQRDLIRARSLQPDLEYIFKHALTQEVVYNGLLKKERKEIHERIGRVMEHLFQNRLSELYETLAYHFSRGTSVLKAVDYLVKSGEKSLKRYSVDESHLYFKEAFELITGMPEKSNEINDVLIDLLNRWGLVYYYRGDYLEFEMLLTSLQKT
ncbi:MAG: adenylate/guanylate cyclase domain-containing protein, partial [Thermodesulfobacteriota bacterium]